MVLMTLRGWYSMKRVIRINDAFAFLKKSKIKAGDGLGVGKYPFYTSSSILSKYLDSYEIEDESLIFGTGGSASVHHSYGKFSTSTDCFVAQSNNKFEIDLRYVYLFLSGNIRILENGFKGAGLKHISKKYLEDVEIPLPTLETQKKIVEVLDKAQGLIDARKEQIRLMDELIQSVFYEMFGDPVTNPKDWEKYKLAKFISFLTSGSRGWSQYFRNEGEIFLTIKNVKNNEITLDNTQYVSAPNIKESERTKVQEGDLLISITADLGRTGVVNSEIAQYGAYINQHLSLVRLNDEYVRPMYVSFFLESKGGKIQFDARNQNGVKAGLNFNAIKSLELLVPPTHLQDEFVKNVNAINQYKSDMKKNLDEIYKNYNALMQKAFIEELFGG